jgi:hypothetical protein
MTATLNFTFFTAPNLNWESTPAVNPPLLTVGLSSVVNAGDHLVIERSAADTDPWTTYLDITIADPNAPFQNVTASALPSGDHVLRARLTRAPIVSTWSTSINMTLI